MIGWIAPRQRQHSSIPGRPSGSIPGMLSVMAESLNLWTSILRPLFLPPPLPPRKSYLPEGAQKVFAFYHGCGSEWCQVPSLSTPYAPPFVQ